ncbi:hypothetical protein JCM5296_003965 [Sporobolomyces johnsonii]
MSASPSASPLASEAAELDYVREVTGSAITYLVVFLSILLWDTVATFPSEYRHIWRAKWTPVKVAFLLNRYWTVVYMTLDTAMVVRAVSPGLCQHIYLFQPAGNILVLLFCACILSTRILALYEGNRKLLVGLIVLLTLQVGVMVGATTQFRPLLLSPDIAAAVDFHGCVAIAHDAKAGAFVAVFWAAPLVFDTVILVLTVLRVLCIRRRSGPMPILRHFLRDGLFYYMVVFATDVANVSLYAQSNTTIQNFSSPASTVLTSLMASRLVLSLFSKNALSLSAQPAVTYSPEYIAPGFNTSSSSPWRRFRARTQSSGPEVRDDEKHLGGDEPKLDVDVMRMETAPGHESRRHTLPLALPSTGPPPSPRSSSLDLPLPPPRSFIPSSPLPSRTFTTLRVALVPSVSSSGSFLADREREARNEFPFGEMVPRPSTTAAASTSSGSPIESAIEVHQLTTTSTSTSVFCVSPRSAAREARAAQKLVETSAALGGEGTRE